MVTACSGSLLLSALISTPTMAALAITEEDLLRQKREKKKRRRSVRGGREGGEKICSGELPLISVNHYNLKRLNKRIINNF